MSAAELDAIAHGFTGRTFADFVAFAREAQRAHGYLPTPVPMGPGKVYVEAAERFAAALETEGLRVGRAGLGLGGAR